MKHIVLIGTAALVLLSGCAAQYTEAPTPTRWEASRQHKLTAAEYWRRIADHFAAQLVADLREKGSSAALYIPADENGEFPFVEGFRELLTTALVRQGQDVRTRFGGSEQIVDVRYSIYRFDPARAANTYYYGEATALTTGLIAIGGIVSGGISATTAVRPVSVAGRALGTIGVLEGMAWAEREGLRAQDASGPVPQSEILLTASITEGDRFVTRYSSIYYAADEDVALYWTKRSGGRGTQIRVKGVE
ncbi:MAG: hypothetical protein LBD06_12055 [Candidatus Accumulibacter sp.]|nr:hypothetical protein [Accumulibacter sp.]